MTAKRMAARFEEVDLEDERFVAVKDGEKMCVDHDTRYSDPRDVPGTNYGIYCNKDDQLFVLDVDVHRGGGEEHDERALVGLAGLGLTLTIQSPHADGEIGGHRIFKLNGDETPAELFDRVFGRQNPVPSWGEVVSKNKYVVGPGSELDGCTKDWCDDCATDEGGHYVVDEDRKIATVEPDELVKALDADDDLSRGDQPDHSEITDYNGSGDPPKTPDENGDLSKEQVEGLLEAIPGDQHFDEWVRTGYAIHSWDDTEVGKQLFEEWSRNNPKWEQDESQRQIDYIWQNGDSSDRDNNAGVGTLVHIARENDYDGDLGSEPAPDPPSTSESDDVTWSDVKSHYEYAQREDNYPKGHARLAAANVLESETSWMYVLESERLWVYDAPSGQYQKFGDSHATRRLEQELGQFYTGTERREIIGRLEARNQVHREVINARMRDDPLLCVGNGVVNLRTGDMNDHGPEYRFIRGVDVEYDPATADPGEVLDFLDDVTERVADRDTLLDHLAHGLMPGHPYRAFLVAYGPGGNGKTQVAELFRGFVGAENAAAVEIDELASGDFATGDLPGTFLNWGDDMAGDGGGQLTDLSLLKKASGGSEIRANEKYEKTYNFKNEAAMFFSANEPPRIGEQKASIQDRIYPIEMPYRFTSEPNPENPLEKEKTPNISKTLLDDEGSMKGLLLLAVKHAQQLIESNGKYSQPETPQERLEKYNRSADPIVRFGGKALEEASADYKIRKDDAHRVFRGFAESWEERAASERGFKRQLPSAFPSELEGARSRALASPDDGEDRVRCWKRVKWTDTARQHMPEWMLDRYKDHFEPDETPGESNDESGEEDLSLEELEPGRHTLEVKIAEKLEPKPWQQARGHVVDEDKNILPYVAEGTNLFANVQEGQKVKITNAKIATNRDGLKQIEVSGVCEVQEVATPEAGQSALDEEEGSATATDGGTHDDQLKKRVKDLLRTEYGPAADVSVAGVAGAIDASPENAKSVLEALATREGILDAKEEGYQLID